MYPEQSAERSNALTKMASLVNVWCVAVAKGCFFNQPRDR